MDSSAALTGVTYGMLFLLGLVLGVVGGFEHGWYAGEVPVGALVWLLVLLAVPYVMGRLMGGKMGAVMPAVGWLVTSFLLTLRQPAGDLAIAANTAGYCYLYGGTVAVVVAVLVTRSNGSWLMRRYGKT
jgi:hypothetical protein